MLNRIDRYISGLFWLYFVGGILVFLTLFLAIDAMSTMVSYKDVLPISLLKFYGYYAPEIIYRMIPVSALLATVFTLSTLNRSNELVALFSVGMSLVRVTAPILIWVLFLCGGVLYLSDKVLPNFAKQKNFIFYHEIKKRPSQYSIVKNERIWYRSKDAIFNIKTLNEKTQKAQGLTLYYFNDEWDLIQMITAKSVDVGAENWRLHEGSVTLFTKESSFPITSPFKDKTIVMNEDARDLSSTSNTSDMLSLGELKNYIQKNKEAGLDVVRYEVDYQSKYGFAAAAFVMCLLGIPFSVGKTRSGGIMINLGICLALIFAYWIFFSSALTLGNYSYVPAIVAAWAPNLIMSGLAIYFIYRMKR